MSVLNAVLNTMIDFTYEWNLSDLKNVKKNGLNVFSCFSCGGGSSMGYKMSGFNVIGCNEIDPQMMEVYKENHNPKYSFLESIETFKLRNDLPDELYNLDILDGSPPCSSFSMSGSREKYWGKNKKFREGQKKQILDDLFFHYIELAGKLKPKIIIAENVKGMLIGNAKGYVKDVIKRFKNIGYTVQLFLLNGATMGLPQKRERVFFICQRKDLNFPELKLEFKEIPVSVKSAFKNIDEVGKSLTPDQLKWWSKCKPGFAFSSVHPKKHWFNAFKLSPNKVAPTVTASGGNAESFHWKIPAKISNDAIKILGSYPQDYNFLGQKVLYYVGMSVPPLMMHKISKEIYHQWLP